MVRFSIAAEKLGEQPFEAAVGLAAAVREVHGVLLRIRVRVELTC